MKTTVVDNSDGSYRVSYTPVEPGLYSVWVCVKARHVKVRRTTATAARQGYVVGTMSILVCHFKTEVTSWMYYIILIMITMNNSNHYDCYCCYYERFDVEKMSATELSLCSLKSSSRRLVATPPVGFWLRPLGQPCFCALKSPALHP